jgi:hypothetical protein
MSLEECVSILEQAQVRRVPVVDSNGRCCEMISQADIAANSSERQTGMLPKDVARPTISASEI